MIHPTLKSLGNAERGDEGNVPAVVLLTGGDRLSLDSVAFSLLDGRPDAGMIAYDVRVDDAASAGLSVVRRCLPPIGRGGACDPTADVLGVRTGETESLPVDECCLSCTVKHDLERQLGVWAESGVWRDGGAVGAELPAVLVVLPVGVEGVPIAQYLEDAFHLHEWGAGMRVAAIANAVGLDEFEERFYDDAPLMLAGSLGGEAGDDGVFDERSTGVVVSRLIHEATHVLELPVIGRGCLARHVDASGECMCRAIIRAIAAGGDGVVCEDAHEATLDALVRGETTVDV